MDVNSRKVSNSREDSNIQQEVELYSNNGTGNRNITDINSKSETRNSNDSSNSRDANNSLALGTPTAQCGRQQLIYVKKDTKKFKFLIFSPIDSSHSDIYRIIGSAMYQVVRQLCYSDIFLNPIATGIS
jgi:hypothetical protein